ncbi:MAG: hypothetical protein RLZZ607_2102 [Pseudomonadota bacterium]|jgi:alpha-D-ribose 1-methylphosphonate 5-triphosphate diphosphatase
MFDADEAGFNLVSGLIMTPQGLIDGTVEVEAGRIVAVRAGRLSGGSGLDFGTDYLIPGIVDLHTDHIERHVFPRMGVMWNYLNALMAHDGVVVSGGTTTVFDSLCVGESIKQPERSTMLAPLVAALEQGQKENLFRADHLLHLRCEICDPDTMALTEALIQSPLARVVSVMDHTPGDRQSPDAQRWLVHMARELGLDLPEARERMTELLDRSARVGVQVRAHVVARAHAAGLPILSHDDRTAEQVDQAHAEGISVSEFPTTMQAAMRARALGVATIMGAPNLLRGGSQSGNVALREVLQADLCDALCSDYVPRSLLDAAFTIGDDDSLPQDLTKAVAMVSDVPAQMAGLTDRGRIAPGLRADLVRVRRIGTHNHVVAVWRQGQRVL